MLNKKTRRTRMRRRAFCLARLRVFENAMEVIDDEQPDASAVVAASDAVVKDDHLKAGCAYYGWLSLAVTQ